jgi:hypothetical protein
MRRTGARCRRAATPRDPPRHSPVRIK